MRTSLIIAGVKNINFCENTNTSITNTSIEPLNRYVHIIVMKDILSLSYEYNHPIGEKVCDI